MKAIKEMDIPQNMINDVQINYNTLLSKVVEQDGQYQLRYEFPIQIRATPSITEVRSIYLNVTPNSNGKTSTIKLNGFGNNSTPHIATISEKSELKKVLWDITLYMTQLTIIDNRLSLPQMREEYYDIIKHLRKEYLQNRGKYARNTTKHKCRVSRENQEYFKKYDLLHQKHKHDLHRMETRICRKIRQLDNRLTQLNNQVYDDKKGMAARIKELEQYNRFLLDYIELLNENQ